LYYEWKDWLMDGWIDTCFDEWSMTKIYHSKLYNLNDCNLYNV
jgi:hypothetical protein